MAAEHKPSFTNFRVGFCSKSESTIVCHGNKTYCSGKNNCGQLGIGKTPTDSVYMKVMEGLDPDTIKVLISGGDHFYVLCAREQRAICWGRNDHGQLGLGDKIDVWFPCEFPMGKIITMIACGELFSMCLTFEKEVFSWGEGGCGQLGHGDRNYRHSPSRVNRVQDIEEIACGFKSSFAWNRDYLYAWGFNDNGELGLGYYHSVSVPTRTTISLLFLICGGNHAFCVKNDRTMLCWGRNYSGQLGLKDPKDKNPIPQEVVFFKNHEEIYSIACGSFHTLFWTSKGVFACGLNGDCQIGLGSENRLRQYVPTFSQIHELTRKKILSIGAGHCTSFCLTTDGLYAWGSSKYNQIDDNIWPVVEPLKMNFPE